MTASVSSSGRQGLWLCTRAFRGDLGHTGAPQGEGAPGLLQAPRAFTTHERRAWRGTRVPSERSLRTRTCRDFSRTTGGGSALLLRPCPVSSHPGPPLLGLGKDFHSPRGGTRETGVLGSCPSHPVCRGSSPHECSAAGPALWQAGAPPSRQAWYCVSGWPGACGWKLRGAAGAGSVHPTPTHVTPKERAEAGLARR